MNPAPPSAVANWARQPSWTSVGWTSLMITRPPGRITRASSATVRSSAGRCTNAKAQTAAATEALATGGPVRSPSRKIVPRQLLACFRQHDQRAVDASHRMAPPGQRHAMAAGAAGGIQHRSIRQLVEQRVHGRFLDGEQAKRRIVRLGPKRVAGGDVVLRRRQGRGELGIVKAVEQRPHLADLGFARGGIAGEGQPKQREPLGAEQQLAETGIVGR